MTSIAVGNRRLLKLAKILDTADALHKKRGEPTYSQEYIKHTGCGTPACAWGHYTASVGRELPHWYNGAESEFNMSSIDVELVFGGTGCNNAQTAKQAAKYIRAFVKARS